VSVAHQLSHGRIEALANIQLQRTRETVAPFLAGSQARLVDKILKGANPAEIPVEVNSKIMFTINLKVAKALGLTIAPEMLYRADRIIR